MLLEGSITVSTVSVEVILKFASALTQTIFFITFLETPTQVFYCEFCETFKNTYFEKYLRTTTSVFFIISTEGNLGPCRTFMLECLAKITHGF